MNAPAAPALLTDRSRFLGGSDAAAVLGLAPKSWSRNSPVSVWLEKTGQVDSTPTPEEEKLFRRGKRMEPIAIDMLIEDYGVKVTKRSTREQPNRYIDPEHAFLSAEIDFEFEVTEELADLVSERQPEIAALIRTLVGTTQNGEIKTLHHFAQAKFGEAGTEETPIEYATQAMHGLMVTGRQITMFGVLVGSDQMNVYWIARDDVTIAAMRKTLVAFWQENVIGGREPEPIRLPDVIALFNRAQRPIVVEADEAMFRHLCELEEAKAAQKVAAERIDDLKFELGKAMLGADAIARAQKPRGGLEPPRPTAAASDKTHMLRWQDEPVLAIALERQTRVDSKLLKELHPEVAAECSKESKFFKFREPTKKEKLLAR
jgi:predicted phage-related endonuclease